MPNEFEDTPQMASTRFAPGVDQGPAQGLAQGLTHVLAEGLARGLVPGPAMGTYPFGLDVAPQTTPCQTTLLSSAECQHMLGVS